MALINKPQKEKKEPNYNRNLTDRRKARQGVYNSKQWRELRLSKLMQSPICERCLQRGVITAAEHIHHKDSFLLKDGTVDKSKAYDFNNLESLCPKCHTEEHIEQKRIREQNINNSDLPKELEEEKQRLEKIKRLEEDGD